MCVSEIWLFSTSNVTIQIAVKTYIMDIIFESRTRGVAVALSGAKVRRVA